MPVTGCTVSHCGIEYVIKLDYGYGDIVLKTTHYIPNTGEFYDILNIS